MNNSPAPLKFGGSLHINLAIALGNLDEILSERLKPLGITPIEWYILRSLYETDGQHASVLARTVGRAATSFTPGLDKLQNKGLIERRPDKHDRRAIHIYLTKKAKTEDFRDAVHQVVVDYDDKIAKLIPADQLAAFKQVLLTLQTLTLN